VDLGRLPRRGGRSPGGRAKVGKAVGDRSSDGKTEWGVLQQGIWYLDYKGNGAFDGGTDRIFAWGDATATPIAGHWGGDGRTEVGVIQGNT
jgi:hypothetical protein